MTSPEPHRPRRRPGGESVAKELAEASGEPLEPSLGTQERRRFQSPGFQRMKTSWDPADEAVMDRMHSVIEDRILVEFPDAYRVLNQIWDIVRTPVTDESGRQVRDRNGMTVWRKDAYGRYEEDWNRLSLREKEDIMYSITTQMFAWEQKAADAWGEAMFARAQWEESFANAFDSAVGRDTVDAKTQYAQGESIDVRYWAVFMSAYSRKVDALVRSMERLSFRLERGLRS